MLLHRLQQEVGVPAEILVAIVGVETFYGKHRGSFRALDALTTLAFDYPPRSRFFRSELEQFLLLVRDEGLATLVATHNLELAHQMHRVVHLEDGQLREVA